MNFIKEAENILKYYKDLNRSVDHMGHEIAKLISHNAPTLPSAVSLDLTGVHGSGHEDDNTYNVLYKIQLLSESREKTRSEMELVNIILQEICQEPGCEEYKNLLIHWYVNRTPKEEIAEIFGYSSKQSAYNLRDQAIKKFAVRYFGIDAMKAI